MDDMISISRYGREKSSLFKDCSPKKCLSEIDEILFDSSLPVYDYNFLAGVKLGILIQNNWEI